MSNMKNIKKPNGFKNIPAEVAEKVIEATGYGREQLKLVDTLPGIYWKELNRQRKANKLVL